MVLIRPIQSEDAEDFIDLRKEIENSGFMLYESGERTTTFEQQTIAIEQISSTHNSNIFVAEREHSLAGFIAVIGGKAKRNQHTAHLALGVRSEYQGQGIATQLLNQVFEWANDVSISRLELTVVTSNTKAYNLYQKLGFTLEGEKVNSLVINGKYVNEYYLYKLL